jgi:hypothetical protein
VNEREDETGNREPWVEGVFSGEERKLLDAVLEAQNVEG